MTESERLKARIDALKKKLIALKEMNRGFGLMRVTVGTSQPISASG